MGTASFAPSAEMPKRSSRLPQQRLSAAARLRRLEEALAFLRIRLATGPQPAKTLQAAYTAGIAERTLHRARDVLLVTTEHTGWHGRRAWVLPKAQVSVPRLPLPFNYSSLGKACSWAASS